MEGLVTPLQDRIEEWKKTANLLDKDHAKGEEQNNPAVMGSKLKNFVTNVSHNSIKCHNSRVNCPSPPQNTSGLVRR